MDTPTYLYRCTEQQLEEHLQRIAEEGDAVEHVIFKGGRDYVLVCRKASDQDPVVAALDAILEELRAVRQVAVARFEGTATISGVTVNGHPVRLTRKVGA